MLDDELAAGRVDEVAEAAVVDELGLVIGCLRGRRRVERLRVAARLQREAEREAQGETAFP